MYAKLQVTKEEFVAYVRLLNTGLHMTFQQYRNKNYNTRKLLVNHSHLDGDDRGDDPEDQSRYSHF